MDGPNEKDNKLNVSLEDFAMRKGPIITGVVLASLVHEPSLRGVYYWDLGIGPASKTP